MEVSETYFSFLYELFLLACVYTQKNHYLFLKLILSGGISGCFSWGNSPCKTAFPFSFFVFFTLMILKTTIFPKFVVLFLVFVFLWYSNLAYTAPPMPIFLSFPSNLSQLDFYSSIPLHLSHIQPLSLLSQFL